LVILSSGILFFTDDCKIRDPPECDFPGFVQTHTVDGRVVVNGSHIFLNASMILHVFEYMYSA
jgi:hypothetical protein